QAAKAARGVRATAETEQPDFVAVAPLFGQPLVALLDVAGETEAERATEQMLDARLDTHARHILANLLDTGSIGRRDELPQTLDVGARLHLAPSAVEQCDESARHGSFPKTQRRHVAGSPDGVEPNPGTSLRNIPDCAAARLHPGYTLPTVWPSAPSRGVAGRGKPITHCAVAPSPHPTARIPVGAGIRCRRPSRSYPRSTNRRSA